MISNVQKCCEWRLLWKQMKAATSFLKDDFSGPKMEPEPAAN
jgi:hypothetical protein